MTLTPSQRRILHHLSDGHEHIGLEIRESLGISRTGVYKMLASLEDHGLVVSREMYGVRRAYRITDQGMQEAGR